MDSTYFHFPIYVIVDFYVRQAKCLIIIQLSADLHKKLELREKAYEEEVQMNCWSYIVIGVEENDLLDFRLSLLDRKTWRMLVSLTPL
jgi:hypothetical protein